MKSIDLCEVYIFPLTICSFFMIGNNIVEKTARLPIISILGRLLQKLLSYQQHAQFTVAYPPNWKSEAGKGGWGRGSIFCSSLSSLSFFLFFF